MTFHAAVYGTVALGAMAMLALCSLPAVRKWSYTFFTYSHWVGFSVLLVAVRFFTLARQNLHHSPTPYIDMLPRPSSYPLLPRIPWDLRARPSRADHQITLRYCHPALYS